MRSLILLVASLPALALNNSVTIYEAAGNMQPGRPLSIARWFAQGEIANYPAPYVLGGAAITPWQADVKTRWSDGSVQFAMVSFTQALPANGSVSVEFQNSANASSSPGNTGLTPAQLLAFNGGAWGAKIQTTANSVTQSADARVMLGALPVSASQLRCWLCGPVVTQMIVEDRSTARAYDWGYKGAPISVVVTGNSTNSTLNATNHGLVNGNSIWLAVSANTGGSLPGGLTAGTGYYVVNATANTFQVSAAPGGSPIPLTGNGSGAIYAQQFYSNTAWTAADAAHQSLHPIFVITAYAGWPGVRTEYILENTWTDRVQDQWFDSLTLYSGAAETTVAAAVSGFEHASRSRWRKLCWDGTAPVGEPQCGTATAVITPRPKGILVDYNFPYMVYSGAVLPLDTTRPNVAYRLAEFWAIGLPCRKTIAAT